jgi:hypothetical protein
MAHPTIGVIEFCRRWKRRYECLIWIAVYNARGSAGTAEWYSTAESRVDEEDDMESEDDYEPDEDDEHDESDYSEYEEEDNDDSESDVAVSDDEADWLMEDSYGEASRKDWKGVQIQGASHAYQPMNHPKSELSRDPAQDRWERLRRKTEASLATNN